MKKLTETQRNRWAFSLGTVGRDMTYSLFTLYLMVFINYTKSLSDAQFAVIGVIFVVCRIYDALIDPFIGGIVDRTRTRFGKFKPYILAGMIFAAIDFILLFSLPIYGWAFVAFLAAGYVVFSTFYSINDIAYWGMLPALSSETAERHRLVSLSNICGGAGTAMCVALVPMLTAGDRTIGGSAVRAYTVIAVVTAVLFVGFQSITLVWVKEPRAALDEPQAEKLGFKETLQTVIRNDQLLWASVVLLIQCVFGNLCTAGLSMAYVYLVYGYDGVLVPLASAGGVSAMFVTLFLPKILKKISRRRLMRIGCAAMFVGAAVLIVSGLMPREPQLPGFLVYTFASFFTIGGGVAFYQVLFIDIANIVEYNEWKTGRRSEGLIFSLRPVMVQIGSAFVQLIIMAIFLALGITQVNRGISDLENEAQRGLINAEEKLARIKEILAAVPNGKTFALLLCMALLPAVIALAGYWIYKRKFKLDEAAYDKILAELETRKAEEKEGEGARV